MNSLDSRYLRLGDTFAHRFTHSGRYVYAVGAPGGIAPPGHHTGFEIVVEAEKGAASQTHYVTVAWRTAPSAWNRPTCISRTTM